MADLTTTLCKYCFTDTECSGRDDRVSAEYEAGEVVIDGWLCGSCAAPATLDELDQYMEKRNLEPPEADPYTHVSCLFLLGGGKTRIPSEDRHNG